MCHFHLTKTQGITSTLVKKNLIMYTASDKMCDLIGSQFESLHIISRFGLPLGVGEKTIDEVCKTNNVDTKTFLIVVNYKLFGNQITLNFQDINLNDLITYLRNAHTHFFDFNLPYLRRKLIESINQTTDSKIPMLIIKFFDEYVQEISLHMQHENEQVFPYVESLIKGERIENFTIEQFAHQHRAIDDQHIASKLSELKNLIIKYYPATSNNNLLFSTLCDIFETEQDLATHCAIEDNILLPAVRLLEKQSLTQRKNKTKQNTDTIEALSDREIDVLREVVQGLSNKEIADKLFISIHTVISHRKNITRKLNIHTTAGLTIYAIVNNLIDINEYQQ
ncbi:MAG: helix-turn-helix transcriptional regulator [Paludibacteraceae bacterium]|nr:helix-turn-helix transcriptional regulator [Paludibacteraceae bacterium]